MENGDCAIMQVSSCIGPRIYLGHGTTCDESSCPVGVCCYFNQTCELRTGPNCVSTGGVWSGPDVACADTDGNGTADACEPCPADLNGDGTVEIGDFLILLGSWGDC